MLDYCGNIIQECREDTGETDYSDTNGTPQSVALKALNEGQKLAQSIIYNHHPSYFDNETTLIASPGVATTPLPANTYLGRSILGVFYSPDGADASYYPLDGRTPQFRVYSGNLPIKWIPIGSSSIFLDPPPLQAGKIKIIHNTHLDRMDLRRGRIASAPVEDGGSLNYVSIELDTTADETALAANDYVCINDRDGNVKYYNLPYTYATDYNSTHRVLTFASPQLKTGGTIAEDDYITCGRYTTTHSKLDDVCLPLLQAFLNRRFYLSKSSVDAESEKENIGVYSEMIVKQYQKAIRGPKKYPYVGKFE